MAVSRKNRKNMNKNKNRNNRDKKTRNKRLRKNTRNKRNRNKAKVSRKKRMRGGSRKGINPYLTERMASTAKSVHGNTDPRIQALLKKLENKRQLIKKFYNKDLGFYGGQLSAINVAKKYSKIFGNEDLTLQDWADFSNNLKNIKPYFKNSKGKSLAVRGSNLQWKLKSLNEIRPMLNQIEKLRGTSVDLNRPHPRTSPRNHERSPLMQTEIANFTPEPETTPTWDIGGREFKLIGDNNNLTHETNLSQFY